MLPFLVSLLLAASTAAAPISRSKYLRDGETILSARQIFEMGFFSPGSSKKRYLGIWFKNPQPQAVVWVANREKPLDNSTGVLLIDERGRLLLLDRQDGEPLWSTRGSPDPGVNAVAELLDSGNLVLRDSEKGLPQGLLWQSIEDPDHVMLPGMRIMAGRYLTSWKSPNDPSPGMYTFKMDFTILPRLLMYEGSRLRYSTGHFNGFRFIGVPYMQPNPIVLFIVETTGDQADYRFEMNTNTTVSILNLSPNGVVQRLLFEVETSTWKSFTYSPVDECDRFANCGAFGICNMSTFPVCGCLEGYAPRNPREWNNQNTSSGCVRQTIPDCSGNDSGGDGFLLMPQLKLPHLINAMVNRNMTLQECRHKCAEDCSCTAYASANVTDDRGGCITWLGDLLDIRILDTKVQDLYIRVPASSLVKEPPRRAKVPKKVTILVPSILFPGVVLSLVCCCILKKRTNTNTEDKNRIRATVKKNEEELPLFALETVVSATSDFSPANIIGEGGFGVVYKGILADGREVAVKRLTRVSVEGQSEFTNEVKSLARLRHRNLVQLLGCCIAGEEKMLIYEYMKNKSLDAFIFDEQKRAVLGWRTRLDIVMGIARGLQYLHHDSGSRIIHRDLKAWNVLLDEAMTPKISDFGTARIFGADQMLDKTRKIIGTYGYMSPEYAIDGVISMKSDVFSFGVLVLEIICGVRNRGQYITEPHESLLSKAWGLWKEGKCAELLDDAPSGTCPVSEVLRCIHVALLCVQERAVVRPTMATVAMMLSSETFPLPEPRRPGFVVFRSPKHATVSTAVELLQYTGNGVTNTVMEGR